MHFGNGRVRAGIRASARHLASCGRRRDSINAMSYTEVASPRVLDGVAIAGEIKAEVAAEVAELGQQGIRPGLAAVLVGANPASAIYVNHKVKACAELGIYSELIAPSESVTTEEMLALIAELNRRHEIDGILIQLPLPPHVDTKQLLEAVLPEKDVDGFHPVNAGRLEAGRPGLVPCTPAGIIEVLRRADVEIAGKHAVVVGRSNIVGKPAAMMLLNACATVTVCHRHTVDLKRYTRDAEILVAAGGGGGTDYAGDGATGGGDDRCGDQSTDGCGGCGAAVSRRSGAGGDVCAARVGDGGGH